MDVAGQIQAPVASPRGLVAVVKHNNLLSPPGIEPRIFDCPAPSLIAILNAISRLPVKGEEKVTHHATTTCVGLEVEVQAFLISAPDGGE
jgi:hypothetical protein